MNYKILFIISITLISASVQPAVSQQQQIVIPHIEQVVEAWLKNYFSPRRFEGLTYTEDLFMRIKQHLLAHQYIQHMPHKELKKIVKSQIIALQQKKHLTEKWISRHKKHIVETIKNYTKQYPQANQQKIFEYLNTCKHKICKQLQIALKDPDMLADSLKQDLKKIIKETKK